MEISKKVIDKLGVVPRLELAKKEEGKSPTSTGPHKIKFLKDELVMGKDFITGKERQEIKYLIEENGVKKTYNVPIYGKDGGAHYLVVKLSQIKEGEEVIIEYKRKGINGFVDISKVGEELPSIDYGNELESFEEDKGGLEKTGSVDIYDSLEIKSNFEI